MGAVMFDFFGTLVSYSPSRTEQGYPRAAAIVRELGCTLLHDEWLALWDSCSKQLDRDADATGVEFSMFDAFDAFAPHAGIDGCDSHGVESFLDAYLTEWSSPVQAIAGVREMLGRLRAGGHRLAVVSNTHSAATVHRLLDAMRIGDAFDAVITSIEVGYRKPRPEIFRAALDALDTTTSETVFVGDTHVADYAGPTSLGIDAFLIVPAGADPPADVPATQVLRSVIDLEARLR